MPFSSVEGKWWATSMLRDMAMNEGHPLPVLITDVGAGGGSWLDIVYAGLQDVGIEQRWCAIEAWAPFIERFCLPERYGSAICCDVRFFDFALAHQLDVNEQLYGNWLRVAIFGDVLEHMTEAEAKALIYRAMDHHDVIIIAVPIIHYPQGAVLDNPYEVHVDEDWTNERVMAAFPAVTAWRPGTITSTFIIDTRIPKETL